MWEQGTYISKDSNDKSGVYSYEAKVYDKPSKYGINGGRVSKLVIFDSNGRYVAEYDRAWIVKPKAGSIDRDILNKIIEKYI